MSTRNGGMHTPSDTRATRPIRSILKTSNFKRCPTSADETACRTPAVAFSFAHFDSKDGGKSRAEAAMEDLDPAFSTYGAWTGHTRQVGDRDRIRARTEEEKRLLAEASMYEGQMSAQYREILQTDIQKNEQETDLRSSKYRILYGDNTTRAGRHAIGWGRGSNKASRI